MSVTVPASGAVVIEPDGSLTYTPASEYSGPDAFDYAISDGAGAEAMGHVTVDVTPIDHSPVAIDDSVTTSQDSVVSVAVLANDFDPDVETLTKSPSRSSRRMVRPRWPSMGRSSTRLLRGTPARTPSTTWSPTPQG